MAIRGAGERHHGRGEPKTAPPRPSLTATPTFDALRSAGEGWMQYVRATVGWTLELDPHPGGWGHLLVAIVCMVCAVLRGLSAPQGASA